MTKPNTDALATALEALDAAKEAANTRPDETLAESILRIAAKRTEFHDEVDRLQAELAALRASRGPQEATAQAQLRSELSKLALLGHGYDSSHYAAYCRGVNLCIAALDRIAPAPPVAASGAEGAPK